MNTDPASGGNGVNGNRGVNGERTSGNMASQSRVNGADRRNSAQTGSTVRSEGTPRVNRANGTQKRTYVRNKSVPKKRALLRHKDPAEMALIKAQKEKDWQDEVERVRGGVDKIMLGIIVLLLALGALMVYSASYPTGLDKFSDSFHYLKKHLIFMGIGGVLMLVATFIPYNFYKKGGVFAAYGVAVLLLLAVLVVGTAEGEAKRWIYIGSFSIQPSEIMKVALVLMLAWYIDKYQKKIKERNGFWETYKYNTIYPFVFIGIACGLVLLERHLSGTAIIGIIGLSVMLVGGCHFRMSTITTAIVGVIGAGGFLMLNPYALARITTFISKDVDPLKEGWQTTQGLLAIGSGGPFGVGFGESRQKFGYVSMAHNDFIYTIWCEELGFVGAVLLILLFMAFMWRGYVIAMKAPDTFSMLTVFGITTQVAVQAFLNMMVVCDIIPNTGISLPFFSYGGSSLIMLMAEMGIILSISRQYYRKKSV